MTIGFALQAHPGRDAAEWLGLVRRAEDAGFETISIADHPGSTAAPFVALAALASATERIGLAPAVVNAGAWRPLGLAAEVATLDMMSGGRAVLGVGAGHTPGEWTMTGSAYPSAAKRVAHMIDLVDCTRRLLAGETVTFSGPTITLNEASLAWPSPPRRAVPLLIGGYGRRLVQYGATNADIVEIGGLGRTLPDGHTHEPDWSGDSVQGRVELITRAAAAAGRRPRLGVLVQKVELTDDRPGVAIGYREQLASVIPQPALPSVEQLLEIPYVLIGTLDEIVDQLRRHDQQWDITRYTVRADAFDTTATLIERLRQ